MDRTLALQAQQSSEAAGRTWSHCVRPECSRSPSGTVQSSHAQDHGPASYFLSLHFTGQEIKFQGRELPKFAWYRGSYTCL